MCKNNVCLEKTGELDFSAFLTMMHRQMQQENPKAEILEAFRMTDKRQKGYIQASELRAKLTKLGEKLTNKEGDCPPLKESKAEICKQEAAYQLNLLI